MSARNEQLKIKANYWNGLAIACAAAGIVVPALAAYGSDEIWNATVFPVLSKLAYRTILPMLIAFFFSYVFHSLADSCASRIKDD
jgi:hypothetical protein